MKANPISSQHFGTGYGVASLRRHSCEGVFYRTADTRQLPVAFPLGATEGLPPSDLVLNGVVPIVKGYADERLKKMIRMRLDHQHDQKS